MVHAFFIGRALATIVGERVEQAMTDSLSALGRFDAEQRENLRQFTEEVMERARREEETSGQAAPSTDAAPYPAAESADLQATIDNLRAEIAQVRASLQQHRAASS
ncbi:MAG: DUF6825 family protein [Cyanobacteria bacterium P01_H01_bin.119]